MKPQTVVQQAKECRKCGQMKPIGDYWLNERTSDGVHPWCKPCVRAATRKADARRRHKPERIRQNRAKQARYAQRHPERIAAKRAVQVSINHGEMPHVSTLFCFCGLDGCTVTADHYHHVDYSQPLTVIPVCASCHARWHAAVEVRS